MYGFLKNIFGISLTLFMIFSSNYIFSQEMDVDSVTGEKVGEDSNYSENDFQLNNSKFKYLTTLNSPVTLNETGENLINVIKTISKKTGIIFIYDDKLLNINDINIESEGKKLHEVLSELLTPYGISYFEYSYGKIALAKQDKIDEKTGKIQGYVRDANGDLLVGANVMIRELHIGAATDIHGFYSITNIKPGEYSLEISYVGYEKHLKKVKIPAGQSVNLNFKIKLSAFQIGGIEVVGTKDLLPNDVRTKTEITSGEIEHYQASSIKDVLDLVPGVQKTDNPGLSKTSQIAIRGDEGDNLSAFGTLVIVDGSPVSNNANLQFEAATGSTFGTSTMSRGIDLRTIPADNIESIEVITGLPSVKYGDVTEGVINVKTKIGAMPNRLKVKNNPDTKEANLGGGFLFGQSGLSYNLNAAYSERDIRVTGDEYTRLTGQAVYSSNVWDNSLNINNKFSFQAALDNQEPVGDLQQTRNYNHGYTLGLSSWGAYKSLGEISSLNYNIYLNMERKNSMKSKLVQSDLRVLPNGDTVSIYSGKVETKGIEWSAGGRLEWNNIFYTGSFIHKILVGIEPKYEANTGEGLILDSLFNYYGSESGRRSYSFDDIPGQFLLSLYGEDKITGHLLCDFNLIYGIRYDMYRPYKFNLSGLWGDGDLVKSHQGSFFNPRINLMVYLSKYNQLRLSAGTTSKSPPMSTIYRPEDVFIWRNPVTRENTYFHYNLWVPELKGYREAQYEASFDQKISNLIGTSVSFFYKNRSNEPESQVVPVFTAVTSNGNTNIYFIDSYNINQNNGSTISKGIEFTLRTSKIKPLNMDFQIVGAYQHLNNNSSSYYYKPTPDQSLGQYPNYNINISDVDTTIGMVYPIGEVLNDRLQLNYYVKYTHPALGLWITLRAEELVWEKRQSLSQAPIDFDVANETAILDYLFSREVKTKPNKWLFNINISKSLFPGAEVSIYVNNFLDDPAIRHYNISRTTIIDEIRNPSLSYGIEFSMIIDKLFEGQ